jgi:monoterpene epsilon-lactone hydrolase
MNHRKFGVPAFALTLALAGCGMDQQPPANIAAAPGMRSVPAKMLAAPDTVSPEMKAVIGAPLPAWWNLNPKNAAEWKSWVAERAAATNATLPELREKLGVTVTQVTVAGVPCFMVEPKVIPAANRNRLLIHVHGGGYVLAPGEAATREAILMAGYGGYRVLSVDYRMPPDFPYPAAMDDAMKVWREALKTHRANRMAIFGTSTGGGMTLAMVLRAKTEHLPLPAAIAPGTPWTDLTKTGDSYYANEMVDNVLVSNDGWLGKAALLYANGRDLRDPQLSPIYGDVTGFPPTILTTGTRDLFLSNTVRMHRKLRQAGVIADLNVYEGQSHAQFGAAAFAPETKEAFGDIAHFFDKYLAK